MPDDSFALCARVMPAQAFHLFASLLAYCRVIPYQVTCHDGFLGSASSLATTFFLQPDMFSLDLSYHLLLELALPVPTNVFGRPRRLAHKTAHARQANRGCDLAQQACHCPAPLVQHHPQQYDHEILELGLTETASELGQIMAQPFIKTYDWHSHSSPRVIDSFWLNHLLPQGGLCRYYFIGNVPFFINFSLC
jgi:hypothetical protein